jgi:hypothetical protein
MEHLFLNSATVRRKVQSQNPQGEFVGQFATVMSGVPCRICAGSGRRMVSMGKDQVVATNLMYTNKQEAIFEGDLITSEKGDQYIVAFVRPCDDGAAYHHTEIDLVRHSGVIR